MHGAASVPCSLRTQPVTGFCPETDRHGAAGAGGPKRLATERGQASPAGLVARTPGRRERSYSAGSISGSSWPALRPCRRRRERRLTRTTPITYRKPLAARQRRREYFTSIPPLGPPWPDSGGGPAHRGFAAPAADRGAAAQTRTVAREKPAYGPPRPPAGHPRPRRGAPPGDNGATTALVVHEKKFWLTDPQRRCRGHIACAHRTQPSHSLWPATGVCGPTPAPDAPGARPAGTRFAPLTDCEVGASVLRSVVDPWKRES